LPVVLYMGASWSVNLRDGHRLTMFVNRVLRTMFDPKSEEVTVSEENRMMRSLMNL
jgi:hypothetical protein